MDNITCINCGIIFGVPEIWREKRLKDHNTFYCPNGHSQYYSGENETEKLKRLLNEKTVCCERKKETIISLENSNRALKGHLTRLKKQVKE